jgi:D-alanine-D-alanine ligase
MAQIKTIAVLYGSDSSEWEVSCRSGEFVAANMPLQDYDVYEIFARFGKWSLVAMRRANSMRVPFPEEARPEIDKTDFSVTVMGEKIRFDYVYIMQHGVPGETGQMQGYLEMLGIPYSGCSCFVSAMAFDKYSCKCYLAGSGIVGLAPDVFVRKGDDEEAVAATVLKKLGLPVFVKPTSAGSSFGITRVTEPENLVPAIRYAFSENDTVLIEKGIEGRELTCAVYSGADGIKTLPLIEIVTDNDYFDYDAKYNGHSSEICPAPVADALAEKVRLCSAKIYAHLGCKGVVRMDYIAAKEGLYFLEINTIPGMTGASLVPRMVRTAGLDMTEFLRGIIENS